MSGEGRGAGVSGTGLCRGVRGRTVAAAVTDARGMTKRVSARLPGRGAAGRTGLAERLLAGQGKLTEDVPRATAAAAARQGRHRRRRRAAAKPGGPHLPGGRARRRDRPAGRGEPIAVAADLLTILSRERKARTDGAAGDRNLERADAMPGRLHRSRRKLARLSLRQLAEMTSLSDPYLSQLSGGCTCHRCARWSRSPRRWTCSGTLLAEVGLVDLAPSGDGAAALTGPGIVGGVCHQRRRARGREPKAALIAVYRSMLRSLVHLSADCRAACRNPGCGNRSPGHQPGRGPGRGSLQSTARSHFCLPDALRRRAARP